jgi:DNA-binding IclR family transcriptional regulator
MNNCPTHPNTRMLKVMEMIHMLHRRPCSHKDLQKLVDKDKRTVYRYLALIEALGVEVKGRGTGLMTITHCPICG